MKNYILGFLGALLGSLLFSLPWVIVYVYGNYILSLLAFVIGIGSLKGYKLFKGKMDKKNIVCIIIIITSILAITVSTFLSIPLMLLQKEHYIINLTNLKLLYSNNQFIIAIIKDYIISLLFTFLGVSGVIAKVKNNELTNKETNIDLKKVKEVFEKHDALTKENSISKEIIEVSLDDKQAFDYARKIGVIRKYKDNYYYKEKSNKKNIIIIVIVLLIVIITTIGIISSSKEETYYNIPSNYTLVSQKDNVKYYTLEDDRSGSKGVISIEEFKVDYSIAEYAKTIETIENTQKENMKNYEHTIKKYESFNKLHVLEIKVTLDESIETLYYVVGDKKVVLVYSSDYVKDYKIDNVAIDIVNSVKFN